MRRGFSLIELLVVIAILAALVGVAAPYYSDYVKEAKLSKAKTDLDVLKQAVILYNAREDIPYEGPLASQPPFLPLLGERDFMGLQGQYLTNIPIDPWGRNYRLDPYGGFVYSDGPNPTDKKDDIKEYYVKDLALNKVEWEDVNNSRTMDATDLIYFRFNKSVWKSGGVVGTDFDIFVNNLQASAAIQLGITPRLDLTQNYSVTQATYTYLISEVNNTNNVSLGVHSVAFKEQPVTVLQSYQEVSYDRENSSITTIRTKVEPNPVTPALPLRFAVRTHPIKIVPKQ